MKLVCLFCLLNVIVFANSITITGSCKQNCTQTFNDQYGAFWSYVKTNITESDSAVNGDVYTSLGFTNANVYNHSDAVGESPVINFTAILDIPPADSFLDITATFIAQQDEGENYDPIYTISGVGDLDPVLVAPDTYEYDGVANPGQIIITGEVSTQVQMSWDRLGFNVSYTDPPPVGEQASEPGLALISCGVLYGIYRVSAKTNKQAA